MIHPSRLTTPLMRDLEDLRIKLDSLIKQIYPWDEKTFDFLVNAKDSMGLAQLELLKQTS